MLGQARAEHHLQFGFEHTPPSIARKCTVRKSIVALWGGHWEFSLYFHSSPMNTHTPATIINTASNALCERLRHFHDARKWPNTLQTGSDPPERNLD